MYQATFFLCFAFHKRGKGLPFALLQNLIINSKGNQAHFLPSFYFLRFFPFIKVIWSAQYKWGRKKCGCSSRAPIYTHHTCTLLLIVMTHPALCKRKLSRGEVVLYPFEFKQQEVWLWFATLLYTYFIHSSQLRWNEHQRLSPCILFKDDYFFKQV